MNALNHTDFTTAPKNDGPNPIDLHVGARVRLRRKFMGWSQERLAEALGLTFQQVQKYERGSNRISASKLFEIGQALQCKVEHFYEGLETGDIEPIDISDTEADVHAFLMTTEGLQLAVSFPHIKEAKYRRRILELVTTLADNDGE